MRTFTRDDLELLKLEASREKIKEMRAGVRLLKRLASVEIDETDPPVLASPEAPKEHS